MHVITEEREVMAPTSKARAKPKSKTEEALARKRANDQSYMEKKKNDLAWRARRNAAAKKYRLAQKKTMTAAACRKSRRDATKRKRKERRMKSGQIVQCELIDLDAVPHIKRASRMRKLTKKMRKLKRHYAREKKRRQRLQMRLAQPVE